MGRILVTGAGGYLGGHLINTILGDKKFDGYDIRGIDNFLIAKEENYNLIKKSGRVELLKGDITRKGDVKEMMEDVDIVYHLAAISGVLACSSNQERSDAINVGGTQNLLEASLHNVNYFVFASSAAVYENSEIEVVTEDVPRSPGNIYGMQKSSCEALCEEYNAGGLGTVILRFSNIYGKGTYVKWRTVVPTFISCLLKGEPLPVHGSGKQKRNFVHIDDIIGFLRASITPEAKGEKFNVGSFENTSVGELARLVKDIFEDEKRAIKIIHGPPRDATPERTFDISIEKLGRLGWSPKVTLRDGITRTYDAGLEALEHGFSESQKSID